ncbi:MAG: DUF5996 family protein [Chloroflexota bacterium]|nr:DUF5996 family protein [Chloroflexota bacterium]MDE2910868.1 DUF5996 family protein [Chloroflexota bacterium]
MALPTLIEWEETRDALHQIALVMGAIRVACVDPLPNDLHFSLEVSEGGLSTGKMNCGGALHFDVEMLRFSYAIGDDSVFSLDIEDQSQISLTRRLLAAIGEFGCRGQLSMKHITSDKPFAIDRAQATAYASTIRAVSTTLARFRAKLKGCMTPLVLWPHHFDLAFIWFATEGTNERNDPHIAYGFAPFSPGLARPYIYAYAWSRKTGYLQLPLGAPAQPITDAYTGLYAPYDLLRQLNPFDAAVETMLMNYHQLAAQRLPA